MGLLIDGNETYTNKPVGPDEVALLDALHGRGPLGEKLKADLQRDRDRAKYKIEVQFGKDRSHSALKSSPVVILIWESGRRFHGGGDQRMLFCGYWRGQGYKDAEECGKPIKEDNMVVNHLVCPHCKREQFLTLDMKTAHIRLATKEGYDTVGLKKMPIANPMLLANLSSKTLAAFIAKVFRDLEFNADIYVKYHPTDIRARDVPDALKVGSYEKARRDRVEVKENRGLLIYPLKNIVRDTIAGATIESRFLALFNA